jgi:hypothetical protein
VESALNEHHRSKTSHINDTFGIEVPNLSTTKTQEHVNMRMGHIQSSQGEPQRDHLFENEDTNGRLWALTSRYNSRRGVMRENLSSLLGCTSDEETTRLMLDIKLNIGTLRQ